MRLLVFGKTGQVGRELQSLTHAGVSLQSLGRNEADLTDPASCANRIQELRPDAVINAAAYTAVDKAEDEPDLAQLVNGKAPGAMAEACATLAIPFVHISTDYVFDGSGSGPWKPEDPIRPLGVYGASKLDGELAARTAGGACAILRTSWVFSAHGANFVKTMLRLGRERETLSIVADQIGGPTSAHAIAEACVRIARHLADDVRAAGTYHFAGAPDTSWAGFAREIFARAGLRCRVDDILSSDYPTPAARPLNSRLDCQSLEVAFGIARPNWRADLAEVLTELEGSAV